VKKIFDYTFKNGVKIKNRLVLAPMTTYSANQDLTLSDEEYKYYQARGQQFGMVVTAATAISKHAQAFVNQISIMNDDFIPSMIRLQEAIKSGGALAILQLHHGGRMNMPGLYPNQDIVSASAIKANRDYLLTPRALETSEVYEIIEDFAKAVKRAILAGFDGIELHGANTYLLQQFFSPHSNQRSDEFGGNVEKRMTFAKKLINRVLEIKKQFANQEFIIGYRLSPEELENPGITIEDTEKLVSLLANSGIDYIHLSLANFLQTSIRTPGLKKLLIDRIEEIVDKRVAIIGVGQINNKESLETALSLGYDLLAVGMAALADELFVDNIRLEKEPKKLIDKNSLLPKPLYDRIKTWKGI